MSYQLFRSELNALTGLQHVSRIQFAQIVGNAYNNLVMNHQETLTAGGKVVGAPARLPALISGIHSITESNLYQHKTVNFFSQIAPFIYSYWAGQIIPGPTGIVTLANVGQFRGPIIKQNLNFQIWISTFAAVCFTHIQTLAGTYLNTVTGLTTPWAGALLITTP